MVASSDAQRDEEVISQQMLFFYIASDQNIRFLPLFLKMEPQLQKIISWDFAQMSKYTVSI